MNIQQPGAFSHTRTMTTTYYNTPGRDLFRNANRGEYNNPARCGNGSAAGNVQLSSQARMMMTMMGMMSSLMSGDFGGLMNWLTGAGNQAQMPCANPGFGQSRGMNPGFGQSRGAEAGCGRPSSVQDFIRGRRAQQRAALGLPREVFGPNQAPLVNGANAAKAAPGQARELKAGETVRGANGSLVKWGQNGKVDISYQDQNGQTKNVSVKNGMISFDGGKPQKLENVGQLLKLPNGDVVGLGNNPSGPEGKKLCRVVMADNVDQVKTEPASATNIYDVRELEHRQRGYEGGGVTMNVNAGSFCSPFGQHNYMNASINMFRGTPVDYVTTEQLMNLVGSK